MFGCPLFSLRTKLRLRGLRRRQLLNVCCVVGICRFALKDVSESIPSPLVVLSEVYKSLGSSNWEVNPFLGYLGFWFTVID